MKHLEYDIIAFGFIASALMDFCTLENFKPAPIIALAFSVAVGVGVATVLENEKPKDVPEDSFQSDAVAISVAFAIACAIRRLPILGVATPSVESIFWGDIVDVLTDFYDTGKLAFGAVSDSVRGFNSVVPDSSGPNGRPQLRRGSNIGISLNQQASLPITRGYGTSGAIVHPPKSLSLIIASVYAARRYRLAIKNSYKV